MRPQARSRPVLATTLSGGHAAGPRAADRKRGSQGQGHDAESGGGESHAIYGRGRRCWAPRHSPNRSAVSQLG